jgi:hypothetical protein
LGTVVQSALGGLVSLFAITIQGAGPVVAQLHLREVKRQTDALERARAARDAAIYEAHLSGETMREIALYTNISYQRVSKIVRLERERRSE